MNINEGKDLVKMAITVLLISLVISAAMSLWYLLFSKEQKLQSDLEKAANSASMERLYELQDISYSAKDGTGKYPLVTNVVSALSEFNEQDLLFIYIDVTKNGSTFDKGSIYTYTDVNLTTANTGGFQDPDFETIESDIPVTVACRKLLVYSHRRCFVEMFETPYGGNNLIGLRISIVDVGG
jgi:hypothetical protein